MPQFIHTETISGETVSAGGNKITPFSRSLVIQFPGGQGGLIWNRPVSILAQTSDGNEEILQITDVTRQVQWALLAASMLSTLLMWFIFRIIRK